MLLVSLAGALLSNPSTPSPCARTRPVIATDGSDLAEKAVQVGARAGQGRAAEKRDCDVIVMASHGQSGFTAAFLGIETQT